MLQLYPEQAVHQLEFDKIQQLLTDKCTNEGAKTRAANLKFITHFEHLEKVLLQTKEYLDTLTSGQNFPSTTIRDIRRELKLLSVPGSSLQIEELVDLKNLCKNIKSVFSWVKAKGMLFPNLRELTDNIIYQEEILSFIAEILDEQNHLKDDASRDLSRIRKSLSESRQIARAKFDAHLRRLSRLGYLSEIGESFLNGRRCVAVLSENKRIVRGILHGESDTGKTVFIEPENTVDINNEVMHLETEERKEIKRILGETTAKLSGFHESLSDYYRLCGIYDFIRAKALLARDLNATLPILHKQSELNLIHAFHPILWLKNNKEGKETIPLQIQMNQNRRILMISGPNAGGKTVAMKTIGLLQLMLQSGLLVPVDYRSEMGVFNKVMVHIGDTQSIENELSTYSAHLRHMNYFLENVNGRTLFFIDELGSGSDPYLGGTFAEAIVEELVKKHAFGVITTHYLNLKIMAGKTKGMVNAAMLFDENELKPLFRMDVGKPGSSYTFAIAKRSGLPEKIIERARELTDSNHVRLDKLLVEVEKQSIHNETLEKELSQKTKEMEEAKLRYEKLAGKEEHRQQMATLKLQNKFKQEEIDYLKETERKLKQLVQEWKRTTDKKQVIRDAEKLFFRKKQIQRDSAAAKAADKKYKVLKRPLAIGDLIKNKTNYQVGRIEQLEGNKAIIRIGNLPFTINPEDWVVVVEKDALNEKKAD